MSLEDVYREAAVRYRSAEYQDRLNVAAALLESAFSQVNVPDCLSWVTAKHVIVLAERNWFSLGNGQRLRSRHEVFNLHHTMLGKVTTDEQAKDVVDVFDLVRDSDVARAALRKAVKAAFPR